MKLLINKAICKSEGRSLEHTVFIYVSGLGFTAAFIMTVLNFFNNLHFQLIITSITMVICAVTYYFARFKNRYLFEFVILSVIFVHYIAYFDAYGIRGPIPYFTIMVFILGLVFSPKKGYSKFFIILSSGLFVILLIEYMFPQLINNPFKTPKVLHIYLITAITFCLGFSFAGIYFLRQSYDREREKNQQQKALLEKAAYEKSMFFINLSHEIKTPLTLIENYFEKYIEEAGENEKLKIIRQNIRKMRQDILDYLNVETLERGSLSYEKLEIIALSQFLEEKVNSFEPYTGTNAIEITRNIESGIHVNINPKGADQMLNNLLENAVKYTPAQGSINVSLKTEGNSAKLTIQNSGTNIYEDQLPHLFEPFYQLSNEKLNVQGIGMGLYIVKKIVDCTGGHIAVTSNKDSVVFSVVLPLSQHSYANVIPKHTMPAFIESTKKSKATDSSYNIHKKIILLVEDHEDLLCYLSGELSETYNVFVARSGQAALEKLENIPVPDLIISDIMMDKMDGYELLSKTIVDEKLAHVPFIFLTAKDSLEEKIASFEMGALDFITKPFSIDELKMKIKTILEEKDRISEAAVRKIKRQYSSHFVKVKQRNDEIFINTTRYNLTARETEVIMFIQQGLKYEEIAQKLNISEHTVVRHVQNVYKKTSSSTKIDLLQKLFTLQ